MKHFDQMELIEEWQSNIKIGDTVRLPFGPRDQKFPLAIVIRERDVCGQRFITVQENFTNRLIELRPLNCVPPPSWYEEYPEVDVWKSNL